MTKLLVAIALLAACRGSTKSAGPHNGSAFSVSASDAKTSVVPHMPLTDDGRAMLDGLAKGVDEAKIPSQRIELRLQLAHIRGRVEDYVKALDESKAYVQSHPDELGYKLRVQALSAVHRFADARVALAQYAKLVDPSMLTELEVGIDQQTGHIDEALAKRAKLAHDAPNPQTLTLYALTLAELGRFDEAFALLPEATKADRYNLPEVINWLLFQWGRIYELKGDLAIAREFYEEAYRRMPGSLETVEHLVTILAATGDTTRAKQILAPALQENPHPGLRALAVKLGISKESAADVAVEWERYVTALPEAFSDHAARFYLDVGANPTRALELARVNLVNRPTIDARTLVVEAALAAHDPTAACTDIELLVKAPTHAAKFAAWRALSACGRTDDAQRLAKELGI